MGQGGSYEVVSYCCQMTLSTRRSQRWVSLPQVRMNERQRARFLIINQHRMVSSMAEIIHLPHGEQPSIESLEPPCAVFEWKAYGEYEVTDMPGIGRWHHIPDEEFDMMVSKAENMADQIGYQRVYVIGRPV